MKTVYGIFKIWYIAKVRKGWNVHIHSQPLYWSSEIIRHFFKQSLEATFVPDSSLNIVGILKKYHLDFFNMMYACQESKNNDKS